MSSSDAPVPSCEVNYRTEVWTNSRPRPGRLLARAHPGFGATWNRSLGSVSYPATLVPSLGGLASGGPLEQFAASARPTTSAGGSGARGLVELLPRKCASSWTDSQLRRFDIGPLSGPTFDHASACGSEAGSLCGIASSDPSHQRGDLLPASGRQALGLCVDPFSARPAASKAILS